MVVMAEKCIPLKQKTLHLYLATEILTTVAQIFKTVTLLTVLVF